MTGLLKGVTVMKLLLTVIAVLILLTSFGFSGYLSFFKIPLRHVTSKLLAFLMIGAVTTAVTFIICLSIVWPPVMM